jgi:hypothetical protein
MPAWLLISAGIWLIEWLRLSGFTAPGVLGQLEHPQDPQNLFHSSGEVRLRRFQQEVKMVVGAGLLRHVGAFPLADMSVSGKAGTCPAQSKKKSRMGTVRSLT